MSASDMIECPFASSSLVHLTGRIFNLSELISFFDLQPTGSPEGDVLLLCEAQGEKIVQQFKGEFALALSLPLKNETLLSTDTLGVVPLFYKVFKDRVIVSSHLQELLEGENYDFEYLLSIYNEDFSGLSKTPYKGIKKAPPGTIVRVSEGGEGFIETLRLSPVCHRGKSLAELTNELQGLLQKSILRRAKGFDVGLLLSGGFDSSLLASLIQREAKVLKTYSLRFSGHSEADEYWALKQVIDFCKLNNQVFEYDDLRAEISREPHSSVFYDPTLTLFAPLLESAATDGIKYIITGLGGDDLFSMDNYVLSDLLKQGRVKDIFFEKENRNLKTFDLITLLAKGVVPQFIKDIKNNGSSKNFKGLQKRFNKNAVQKTIFNRFFSSGFYQFAMAMEQQQALSYGQLMSYPLLDMDIINWCMGLNVESFTWRGRDKCILREASKTLLPSSIIEHRSQQDYSIIRSEQISMKRDELKVKLMRGHFVMRNVIDEQRVNELFKDLGNNTNIDQILKLYYAEKIINR